MLFQVVHVVPDRFILGLDGAGVLWNFAILTGYLGICAFLIYIWRTVLAIAPRQYEVTLQQIAEKIHRLKNENRELAKEISIWEEKIRERKKHRAEMKREHQFLSDKILKLKENIGKVERVNANLSVALHFKRTMLQAMREKNVKNEDMAQDALEDEEQGDLESKKRVLKESKKVLEQKCNALSSLKAAKEVELKLLRKKLGIVVDFSERRKVAAEEKLEKTLYELEATKNQLSDAEENLKVTKEEIDKYKQQIGKMQDQLQEAELTFERKIAVHEKNAVGNWIKARVWERKIQQQRRENAYMIHRLRMMKGQMLPEGCMRQEAMLGRPEMWSPPRRGHWSDAEADGAPMRNNGTEPNRHPGMYKVGPDVRGFPRPTCMPCPMDQTLPGFIGCGPPQPPPPWSTCGPPLPLVPPPCGPRSNSETCGAQGDKGGTVPKKDPEKDKVGPDVRGFPRPTCMPCPMDQTLPGFIGCGPPQPPPPWSTCGPPLPLVPPPCGPRSNSETCGAQGDKGGTVPKKDPEKDKVGPDVRGFPRPTCMPCPMDQTLPGFIGCGPPQPPPPWSTCGPPLPLVPPPCGPRSNSETCGAQGDKGGTVPKKDPEKDKVGPDVRGFPRPTCMPCPMDQTLPGFIGCGPPQPPPPWSTCGPPLPLVPPPCGPRSNSETCGAQGDKGGTVPKKDPEKDKVGPDVRGFPRPTCMPCPMDQTLPGFIGCGPPQPPPPWSTCGPPLPLVPPPCGPRSNSETCGAQGDKGGTVPKKDPEKDKVVHVVPDRFILGLDGAGVLWNFAILTGYLGICAFLIYIWRTVLAIAPRQYEVTLQQIAEKIHRLKNENRELAKEISIWEEKIRERKKHRAEMKREHQFLSDKILKLKENIGKVERVNANLSVALHFKRTMLQAMREKNVKNEDMAQDALEDEEQGDLESKKRVLKESKKVLEQKCNALSSLKAAKEVELKLLRKKLGIVVDFSERRKVAAEEKLEKTLYELEATKNQLSDAEENLKVTKEEIDKYKQQIGKMQDQLQEAELTFERKIAVHEKNAVGNWIKARVWERKIQQQRRENAYMIHRLRMMKGQMLPEGCMRQEAMLGRPEMWSPPRRGHWSDAEADGAPMRNNGTEPNRHPGMYKVGPDVRGFPRPTCMPCPMDQTLPGFIGCGPPQPPPPWSTCGPPLPLVPPPCGPRSNSETCGAQGDKGGTVPKKDPEKDKVGPDVRGFPRPTCMPCPMDQTLPGFIGCGPPQPPPPWSTCGPPLPLVPPPCGPRSNSETCGAQGDKGGTVPKKDPEKDKVGPDVRGFPRPTCMPCPMDQTLPGFIGCGPPQPPPPWSTCGPPLPLVPPPCGPRSNSETCGAQGDKGGTVPKKDPEKDKVGPDVRGFPRPTCMPCPMDQTLPGFIGCGPPQPPPPWSTCGPPLPLVPPPCGPRSNSETCGAQGDKGGTVPKKDPEKDKVGPDVRRFPWPTCMSSLTGHITRLHWLWATSPSSTLVVMRALLALRSATMWASVPFRSLWRSRDNSGTAPKEVPEKDKVLYSSPFCTRAPGSCKALLLSRLWKKTSSSSLGVMAGPRCQDAGLFLGRNPEPNSEEREPLSVGT
ncbi:uncharacterized protein LOC130543284 isoform X8 [Ursus arctos]|uniref:uncharacterized protein LOC130543284 isoform X8 n=1 Tax=Ursus arctos TaxID=9644 RepID=UPI0025469792|nr:uncharacterized protein LOC130543284 isoform X8 [Ursus arctos]